VTVDSEPTADALLTTIASTISAGVSSVADTTAEGRLATIVTNTGRIPAQGQALAAASTPVVLVAAQDMVAAVVAATGASTPADAALVGITDGTHIRALAGDAGGRVQLSADGTNAVSKSHPLDVETVGVPLYGSNNQSITITVTSIGNGSANQSTAIDNTSALLLDAYIVVHVKTASSATSATGSVSVLGYATADGGSTYTDKLSGSSGSATLPSPPNCPVLGQCTANANSTEYVIGPVSFIGGMNLPKMPAKWGIVVVNNSGNTLDGSVGTAFYQGIN
jgi:hypothetical protein